MSTLIITLHFLTIIVLIASILLQKSSAETIANASSTSNLNRLFMRSSSTLSFLNKVTILFAVLFIVNSLMLARMSGDRLDQAKALFESINKVATDNNSDQNPEVPQN